MIRHRTLRIGLGLKLSRRQIMGIIEGHSPADDDQVFEVSLEFLTTRLSPEARDALACLVPDHGEFPGEDSGETIPCLLFLFPVEEAGE